MNEQYRRMWILEKEQIARKAKESGTDVRTRELLCNLLIEMDILEAEVVLEE